MGKKAVKNSMHIAFLVALTIGVIVGVVWIVVDALGESSGKKKQETTVQQQVQQNIKDADEAYRAIQEGKVDELMGYYDSKIAKTDKENEKHYYHLQKVTVLFNAKRCDDVISVGKQAIEAGVKNSVAEMIAECYEAKEDKANALKYYETELANMQADTDAGADNLKNTLQKKIDMLKGGN